MDNKTDAALRQLPGSRVSAFHILFSMMSLRQVDFNRKGAALGRQIGSAFESRLVGMAWCVVSSDPVISW